MKKVVKLYRMQNGDVELVVILGLSPQSKVKAPIFIYNRYPINPYFQYIFKTSHHTYVIDSPLSRPHIKFDIDISIFAQHRVNK